MPYPGAGKRYDLKTGLDQFGRPKPKGKPMRVGFTAEMADAARQAGFEGNEIEWAEAVLAIEAEKIVRGPGRVSSSFQALYDEHVHEAGEASAMAHCHEFAVKLGQLRPERRRGEYGAFRIRDPENLCEEYEPGERGHHDCEGDGHHLCDGCKKRALPAEDDDSGQQNDRTIVPSRRCGAGAGALECVLGDDGYCVHCCTRMQESDVPPGDEPCSWCGEQHEGGPENCGSNDAGESESTE